ncbi:MAG TPA: CHASE2 domain-containing protein [Pyrinomonadaceae bacterium]|jgi:CHASE2 domain-containing sensor protein|nr:CHASE2 domain-containing protein [Pyrinomonadaceae bacterium]
MPRKKKSKKRHRKSLRQPEIHEQQSRLQIVLEFGWALLFFVLLAVAKEHFVDRSIVGQHIKQTAYDISQVWLAASRKPAQLPIAVVDISTLQPCAQRLADGSVLYPRQAMEAAVAEVMKQKPAALAIDIDFSPGKDIGCAPLDTEELERDKELFTDQLQFSERGGPPFFDFCLDQERPIFLGVYRSQYDAPAQWLGSPDYSGLAATISLPNETTGEEEMANESEGEPDGVRRSMTRQITHASGTALDSLSFALSKHKPRQLSWSQRLLEHLPVGTFPIIQTLEVGEGFKLDKFLVDFSSLKHLEETKLAFRDGKLTPGEDLNDKLVLMGNTDTAEAVDKFIAPGEVRQVAGVFWHASAVDTLLRGILVQPTKKGELLLDLLFFAPLTLLIFGLRMAYAGKPDVHIPLHRIESIGTKIAAVVIFLFGTYFVSTTRLMWDGFLLVALVTALHPTIESYFRSAAAWAWQKRRRNQ